jgi:hypothetical protein
MGIETLEDAFTGKEMETLASLRPKQSFRSFQISCAAQAAILAIGASWGMNKLVSVRIGNGPRYLAIPFHLKQFDTNLVVALRFSANWDFDRWLFGDFGWFRSTRFPMWTTKDREWAWLAYARVALSPTNQTKPVFDGKASTSLTFLEL